MKVGRITFNSSPVTVTPPTEGSHDKIIIEAKERVIIDAGEYIRTIEAQEAEIKRLRLALEGLVGHNGCIGWVINNEYGISDRLLFGGMSLPIDAFAPNAQQSIYEVIKQAQIAQAALKEGE